MDKFIFRQRKALDNQTCDHIINVFEKSNPEYAPHHDYYGVYPFS